MSLSAESRRRATGAGALAGIVGIGAAYAVRLVRARRDKDHGTTLLIEPPAGAPGSEAAPVPTAEREAPDAASARSVEADAALAATAEAAAAGPAPVVDGDDTALNAGVGGEGGRESTFTCECGQELRVRGRDRHHVYWAAGAPDNEPLLDERCPACERPLPARPAAA